MSTRAKSMLIGLTATPGPMALSVAVPRPKGSDGAMVPLAPIFAAGGWHALRCARALHLLDLALDGDGFAGADGEGVCVRCGRTRDAGHADRCARYELAHVADILRGRR